MTGLSRRSVLFAPVALAAASVVPQRADVLATAATGLRKRLRPYYVSQFRDVKWTSLDVLQPFEFAPSLPTRGVNPEVGDHGDRRSNDRAPRGSGFGEGSCIDRLADDRVPTQDLDVGDQRLDRPTALLAVPLEQLKDQRPEDQFGSTDSGDHSGECRFGFVVHFLESLVSVATAMVKRARCICKSAWPAFISDLIVATAADDEIESIQRAEVRDAVMLWIVVALDSIVAVYLAALFWRAPT
jgi:hypothetical protein